MIEHIWEPLGITDISFWPTDKPDMMDKAAHMSFRSRDVEGRVVHQGEALKIDGVEDCFGGQGCFGSVSALFKILQSLLHDDGRLLRQETTRIMFEPQLSAESRGAMEHVFRDPKLSRLFIGEFPEDVGLDWGIGGLLIRDDQKAWRRKGTLMWSGMPNLLWVRWLDLI